MFSGIQAAALVSVVPYASEPGYADFSIAQQYGGLCRTQYGVCPISPAPVNSVCYCGSVPGIVVVQ